MSLLLDVNQNLYSIRGSGKGEQKIKAAVRDAIEDVMEQMHRNTERKAKGFKPLPCQTEIKDEYGKTLVSIRETRSLEEIRKNYMKNQESISYETREKNLLSAMDEVGNSDKNEYAFKEELAKQLNSALFVVDTNLSPGLEKILDYFGDTKGLFSSINFKEDIAQKCIKDLIDLPNPKTGKPPKTFEQLFSNIVSVNEVFKDNPNRAKYIDLARSYININYKFLIPEKYRPIFAEKGGLDRLIDVRNKQRSQATNIKNAEFEVSEKNFKKMYQVFANFEQFRNKPLTLANYLMNRVPENKKADFRKWFVAQGCKDEVETIKVLTKWSNEAEKGIDIKKNNDKAKSKSDDEGRHA